jgi:tetratricopeptide (TPR) repeat protein
MSIRSLLFVCTLLSFSIQCFGFGIFAGGFKREKEVIEKLAHESGGINDLEKLSLVLKKELSVLPANRVVAVKSIQNVFLANKIASQSDSLNTKSTDLFEAALKIANKLNEPELRLWVSVHYAFYLYTFRKYEQTYPLFVQCVQIANNLSSQQIIEPTETYKKIAFFLMTVGEKKTAEIYFKKALFEVEPVSRDAAAILDNMGVIRSDAGDFAAAEQHLREAKKIALQTNDELRYAKVLGNEAILRYKQEKYTEAKNLLLEDLSISEKGNYEMNSMYALVWLTRVSLASHDFTNARVYLEKAKAISKTKLHFKSSAFEVSKLWLELAQKTNNEKDELIARRTIDDLKKKLSYLDGEDVKLKVHWAMEKKNLQLRLDLEKAEKERETVKKVLAIFLSILLVAGIVVIIVWYRKKYKKQATEFSHKIEQLLAEKEKSERKLLENSNTLDSYKIYLQEKNSQIKDLELAISAIEDSSNGSERFKNKMQAILQSHLVDNRTWAEFKNAFIQENSGYYSELTDNFSDLTDANLRVIFLMKMGMNNGDIARVLGITLEAVKKAKQRLRKKYGDDFAKITE